MEYKWIAQDSDGRIDMYEIKPIYIKCNGWWDSDDGARLFVGHEIQIQDAQNSLINLETHDYKIEDGTLMKVEKEKIFKGSELQYKSDDGNWYDCGHTEYRIKPKTKTVRFRNYIDGEGRVCSWGSDNFNDPVFFTRWIGDWQEVEVPNE